MSRKDSERAMYSASHDERAMIVCNLTIYVPYIMFLALFKWNLSTQS